MNSHRAFAFILVFLGGGLGSILRHAVNEKVPVLWGVHLPVDHRVREHRGLACDGDHRGLVRAAQYGGQPPCLFFTTGVLGGFTTFSSF
jgi:CrcB protein